MNDSRGKQLIKRVIGILVLLLVVVLAIFAAYSLLTRNTIHSIPKENGTIPLTGGLRIIFPENVKSIDMSTENLTIVPADNLDLKFDVYNNFLEIINLNPWAAGEYELNIKSVELKGQTVVDYKLKFKAADIKPSEFSDEQQISYDLGLLDGDEIIDYKFPYLTKITGGFDEYVVAYTFDEDEDTVPTIVVDLRPKVLPPLYKQAEYVEVYKQIRLRFLEMLKSNGLSDQDLPVEYIPEFMNIQFGTAKN